MNERARPIHSLAFAFVFSPLLALAAEFYVSPKGNDANPGSKERPLATLAAACNTVRMFRTAHPAEGVTVRISGGTYFLDRALEFTPEDSGTVSAPVVYAAAAGEKAVLSGGRRLEGGRWEVVNGHKAWVVDISEVKEGAWRFRQLFVNGARCPRTRLPQKGEYHIESLPGYSGDFLRSPTSKFVYAPGDIVPSWRNLRDVDVIGICYWIDNRLPIESVESATRTVTFDRSSLFALENRETKQPATYWVENVFEVLETPGQWYLDRPSGKLYYLPRAGEDMAAAEIIAPRLSRVVQVVGRPDANVHDLRFEGLTFSHTEWQPPADFASSLQAGIDVPGALFLEYAERCAVTGSAVENLGNYAIEVGVGCVDVEISRNRIADVGAGGVRIGHFFSWEEDGRGLTERGLRRKAAMPEGPHSRRITVADNEIAHCGRLTPGSAGVFVGDNADNQVVRNHIHDLFFSGISVGSVQDLVAPAEAVNNVIEHNHVHDVGQGMFLDLSAIYTCKTPASRIRYNVVHDVEGRGAGCGLGIGHDEGSCGISIEKNLVYRCQGAWGASYESRDLEVENNIFAFATQTQLVGYSGEFPRQFTFRRNLVLCGRERIMASSFTRIQSSFDQNLYYATGNYPVLFGDKTLAGWQASGQDAHAIVADPLFVDPEHGDFQLRDGSPAGNVGFEPWDLSDVGPRIGKGQAAEPASAGEGGADTRAGAAESHRGERFSQPPLALHPDNPHIFLFRGRPTVLIGAGEHYGAVLNLDFDQAAYVDELASHKLNHTRIFSGAYRERAETFGIQDNTLAPAPGRYVCPWARSDASAYFDGGNKFDLRRWDDAYFRRLRDFVRRCGERGIVVEVNLFCTMYDETLWHSSPMNAACNVNGIGNVGLREVYSLKEPALTEVQEALARKIAGELNEFDNHYFEVCNEPYERAGTSGEWERRIIAAITETESTLPRKHLISVNAAFEPRKAVSATGQVSIYNFHLAPPDVVGLHWGLGKVIGINETGGSKRDDATYRSQAWEFILAGGALFSHLDFSFSTSHPRGDLIDHRGPGGGSPELRRQLGLLKGYVDGFELVKMKPAAAIASVPKGVRVQVLAEPGRQYAVYIAGGRQLQLGLEIPAGKYRAEWVSTLTGQTEKVDRIDHAGGMMSLSSPTYVDDIALRLRNDV